ncbi:hypothetical protein KY289_001344 [Solanum tuberosum]|nr:hypothetical protein KY289_001344 [Solanum tuberosum]
MERTYKNLSSRLDEIVAKRTEEKESSLKNFLLLIMQTMESKKLAKNVFTSDYIDVVTYEHLLAGSATTSFTFSSIICLVACHPEVEQKLLAEIDVFGLDDHIPTADDLQQKFLYLDKVIKEAMRFYIVSALVARETSAEVEIGGYKVPKINIFIAGCCCSESMILGGSPVGAAVHRRSNAGEERKSSSLAAACIEGTEKGNGREEEEGRRGERRLLLFSPEMVDRDGWLPRQRWQTEKRRGGTEEGGVRRI